MPGPAPPGLPAGGNRPEIDGLRALAIAPVVLHHAAPALLTGGFAGVDVFFVISGYLITAIILRELAEGRFTLRFLVAAGAAHHPRTCRDARVYDLRSLGDPDA